ncbi:uncharacterized protein METZ01_LOCUS256472, partial [marine metagenome]
KFHNINSSLSQCRTNRWSRIGL